MNNIDDEFVVVRGKDILSTSIDNETIIMDIESGCYFGLANTAQHIWTLLENPLKVKDLIDILVEKYRVQPETCKLDVKKFISQMLEEGLIVRQ